MRIYILRHGETDWNKLKRLQGVTDIPLNEKGLRLASLTGQAMGREGIRFQACISSPLIRAKKTAELALEGIGQKYTGQDAIPFALDPRIQEVNLGPLEGTSRFSKGENGEPGIAEIFFEHPAEYRAPEGAESYQDVIGRTGEFLCDMAEKYRDLEGKDFNLLVSTHGCASRAMLMNIEPVALKDYWRGKIPPNCAVSAAELREGKWKLILQDHQYAVLP